MWTAQSRIPMAILAEAKVGEGTDPFAATCPDLHRYLKDANIALISLDWIRKQADTKGGRFLRRQELEARFPQAIIHLDDIEFASDVLMVSHIWESVEHPDPTGWQLKTIAKEARQGKVLFYDFSSLYQYPRAKDSYEDQCFKKAMASMDLLYTAPKINTFRIETLEPWPTSALDDVVEVWSDVDQALVPRKLRDLMGAKDAQGNRVKGQNMTPYAKRGWCVSEKFWMVTRNNRYAGVNFGAGGSFGGLILPDEFDKTLDSGDISFTNHGDMAVVKRLYHKVFKTAISNLEEHCANQLNPEETVYFLQALPHFTALQVLDFRFCLLGALPVEAMEALGRALPLSCRELRFIGCIRLGARHGEALAKGLAGRGAQLSKVFTMHMEIAFVEHLVQGFPGVTVEIHDGRTPDTALGGVA